MNEKLSLQDLVEILYKKAKISKKEADLFFRELFQLILERIYENDPVKIKDFGTFKLTAISSRESVNVNTGAKIEIPAHFRLSFLPDKTLKGLVNEPFSEYETILLEDGLISSDIIFEKKDKDVAEKVEAAPEEKSKTNSTPKQPIQVPSVVKKTEYFHRLNNGQGKSFVYTYTSDKSDEGVITLTFQKEMLSLSSRIREDKLLVVPDPTATVEAKVLFENDNPEELFIEDETTLVTQDFEDIQANNDSIELIESQIIQVQKEKENVALDVEDDDPDRPLIPDDIDDLQDESEEVVDLELDDDSELDEEDYLDLPEDEEDESEVIFEDLDGITIEREPYYKNVNRPKDADSDLVSLEDDNTDIDKTFYSGGQQGLASKIRKRVFIIIFFIIVVCFAVYSFLKLFDVKYDYEKYLGNRNFTLSDTLPFLQDVEPMLSDTVSNTVSSDSVAMPIIISDNTTTVEDNSPEEIETLTTATILDGSNEQKADSLLLDIDKIERRISDRLDINIVNKAQFYLKKNQSAQENEEVLISTEREVVKKEQVETISTPSNVASIVLGRGMTLRSLSNKYYGNPTYWVYIYEANKKKLSNPNDISVGTRLLIPNLSHYGVSNVKDSKEIQKASRLEAQLLNY